jgi:hypothetical protein
MAREMVSPLALHVHATIQRLASNSRMRASGVQTSTLTALSSRTPLQPTAEREGDVRILALLVEECGALGARARRRVARVKVGV